MAYKIIKEVYTFPQEKGGRTYCLLRTNLDYNDLETIEALFQEAHNDFLALERGDTRFVYCMVGNRRNRQRVTGIQFELEIGLENSGRHIKNIHGKSDFVHLVRPRRCYG